MIICLPDAYKIGGTMLELTGLVAYPSSPSELGTALKQGCNSLSNQYGLVGLKPWEQNDIAGRFLDDPILDSISSGNILVADITRLNFNVVYEIGYAIGRQRRVILTHNVGLTNDDSLLRRIGLFDTLGYASYSNSQDFINIILRLTDTDPLVINTVKINRSSPVYVLLPKHKSDYDIRLLSRIKKARLQFRSFDPEESGRLTAHAAIDNVAQSHGVIVPLLSQEYDDAPYQNIRGAFIAGLASALGKELLLLQFGSYPIPLDYRDLVTSYQRIEQIDDIIATFSPKLTARLQQEIEPTSVVFKNKLNNIDLGASAAENEIPFLGRYYLQTDEYLRALRGEVQLVRGRKGSGKTALFFQLRNKLRENKQRVVLDLKPEGYQLVKFKERILHFLEEGTKEHLISAFWEYVLLLEIGHKLLEKDRDRHLRDHSIYDHYRGLSEIYGQDELISEGDFAERILNLTQRITDDFPDESSKDSVRFLSSAEITSLLYKHDLGQLRDFIVDYLKLKDGVWILFDNLDKGWPTHGLTPDDVLTIRCLLDAIYRLIRLFGRNNIECNGIIFIRDDIYEYLISRMPDRGKLAEVTLDWSDDSLLRELVRKRLVFSGLNEASAFTDLWYSVGVSHIAGEESSQYLIDRCLRRPRALIDLLQYCRSHAVNLGHNRIEEDDIRAGEASYSTELIINMGYELTDVFPEAADVFYRFIEAPSTLTHDELSQYLTEFLPDPTEQERLIDFLLWYGFLGFVRQDGSNTFIFDVKNDLKRLKAHIAKHGREYTKFCINPAFWQGLEIKS
jgi:hypothetical protein